VLEWWGNAPRLRECQFKALAFSQLPGGPGWGRKKKVVQSFVCRECQQDPCLIVIVPLLAR
jgi:hypothetical protein